MEFYDSQVDTLVSGTWLINANSLLALVFYLDPNLLSNSTFKSQACPGATTITSLSWVQEQKQKL